jgi:alpha-amylase/alpha-mannosidase (GH57 family)
MHQPFYKDLVSGEYKLPWVRLHALKDYYGMVKVLEEFPTVHQTFNLVPSLLVQIQDYAKAEASDPFFRLAVKPAAELSSYEKEFIVRYFFQANDERVIGRYPRYAELYRILQRCEHNAARACAEFDEHMLRDLQVLSQIAWFDEEYLQNDPQVKALVAKGRGYTVVEQLTVIEKELQAMPNVLNVYREFSGKGQIELSASAFYHPILPLLCDTNIAAVSHPYVALPAQFAHPEDAEEQLRRSRRYFEEVFGQPPAGLWPSEGAVSDETLRVAAKVGFTWTATDNGVLARTIQTEATPKNAYRPYVWQQNGQQIKIIFRDRQLSDLIGFSYHDMDADEAAEHFLGEIRRNSEPILRGGQDALVPIILDGENAWESYVENGRPFLRELYRRIAADERIAAVTISEALGQMQAEKITRVHPGSWIDENFDIWIGAEEDNCAWEQLLAARNKYEEAMRSPRASSIPESNRRTAWEELLIAEGSDWCWWYGPEHSSANRPEFDQLYRAHLANVYRLMGGDPPAILDSSILRETKVPPHELPSGMIQPQIDGVLTSPSEWQNAGRYRLGYHSGAMHSQRSPIQELRYGTDGQNIFFAVEMAEAVKVKAAYEFRVRLRNERGDEFRIRISATHSGMTLVDSNLMEGAVKAALAEVLEIRVSMGALQVRRGDSVFLRLALFRNGLPITVFPESGEFEVRSSPMAAFAF